MLSNTEELSNILKDATHPKLALKALLEKIKEVVDNNIKKFLKIYEEEKEYKTKLTKRLLVPYRVLENDEFFKKEELFELKDEKSYSFYLEYKPRIGILNLMREELSLCESIEKAENKIESIKESWEKGFNFVFQTLLPKISGEIINIPPRPTGWLHNLKKIEKEMDNIEALEPIKNTIKNDIAKLQGVSDGIEGVLKSLEEGKHPKKEFKGSPEKVQEIIRDFEEIKRKIIEEVKQELGERVNSACDYINRLNERGVTPEEIHNAVNDVKALNTAASRIMENEKMLNALEKELQSLRSDVEEKVRTLETRLNELNLVRDSLEHLEKEVENRAKNDEIAGLRAEWKGKLDTLKGEIDKSLEEKFERELKPLKDELKQLTEEVKEIKEIKEMNEKVNQEFEKLLGNPNCNSSPIGKIVTKDISKQDPLLIKSIKMVKNVEEAVAKDGEILSKIPKEELSKINYYSVMEDYKQRHYGDEVKEKCNLAREELDVILKWWSKAKSSYHAEVFNPYIEFAERLIKRQEKESCEAARLIIAPILDIQESCARILRRTVREIKLHTPKIDDSLLYQNPNFDSIKESIRIEKRTIDTKFFEEWVKYAEKISKKENLECKIAANAIIIITNTLLNDEKIKGWMKSVYGKGI